MGAAVVTDRGEILPGTLVENVSLGLAMCAERVALFSCVARDAGKPDVLALVAKRTNKTLTFPCGACLQVGLELGGHGLIVVASDLDGNCAQARLSELAARLPFKP
jgi:cytidine deaminase